MQQKLLRKREKKFRDWGGFEGRGGTVRRGQGEASLGLFAEGLAHSSSWVFVGGHGQCPWAASEAPTVKGRPAMACGFYVGVKMNRYYELCVLDTGFLLWRERESWLGFVWEKLRDTKSLAMFWRKQAAGMLYIVWLTLVKARYLIPLFKQAISVVLWGKETDTARYSWICFLAEASFSGGAVVKTDLTLSEKRKALNSVHLGAEG